MPVRATYDYRGEPKDRVENFHGNQLVYIGWDKHLMFAAPVCLPLPPDMPFAALVKEVLPSIYSTHPDFERIDWAQVQWSVDRKPLQPDMSRGLTDQGIGHKSVIRFVTPGLDGLAGAAS